MNKDCHPRNFLSRIKLIPAFAGMTLGLLLAIAAAEIILANTHFIDTPPGLFRPSPTRAFEHRPNFRGKDIRGNPIQINSRGFRDREHLVPKPTAAYRILVLGDSVAFGDGLRAEETFVKRLEQGLNPNPSGKTVEVLNAGVRGYNTFQELKLLEEAGLSYEPDLVLVAYVLNDAEPFQKQAGLIDPRHGWLIQIKDFVKQHSHLYAFLRRNLELARRRVTPGQFVENYDRQFDPDNPGWIASRNALREMKALAEERNFKVMVAVLPRLEGLGDGQVYHAQKIQDQVVATARALGIETLDLLPVLRGQDAESLKITKTDTFHLNPRGHEIVAEVLATYMRTRHFERSGKSHDTSF